MFFSYIIFTTSPHSSFPLSTFKLISCLSLVTFQDSCSILFWLTHWTSFVQTFPSVVSCRLQHMQPDLDYIFKCSSIVFFYAFPFFILPLVIFCCSTFCSSCHLFNHFLPLISLSPSPPFYHPHFFLACYFAFFNPQSFM